MEQLILRQAAIDALRTCYDTETITMDNGDEYINYGDAVGEIKQLPPIQPEPAQWVQMLINPRMYRCSNCNIAWNKRLVFDLDNGNEMVMKYCPCCGKKMLAEVDYE